jgi:triacylglycerol lipase
MTGLAGSWDTAYGSFSATASTIRVVNQDDTIPSYPWSWLASGFTQVGQQLDVLFYDSASSPTEAICHEMFNYLTVVTNAQPLSPQVWIGTFPDGINASVTVTSAAPSSAAPSSAAPSSAAETVARLPRDRISIRGNGR